MMLVWFDYYYLEHNMGGIGGRFPGMKGLDGMREKMRRQRMNERREEA